MNVAEKLDKVADLIEMMYLSNAMGDKTSFMEQHNEAGELMHQLIYEDNVGQEED